MQTGVREDRLTDADPLLPVDSLQNLRRLSLAPILMSEGLRWRGIKAGRFRQKGNRERMDEFRRIVKQRTVLVGTFLLALSVTLSGCSGSATQEEKKEKMKMIKKKEETDKVEKTEK